MLLLELLLFFNFGLASEFYYNSATHQTANLFEKVRVTSMYVSKCLPSFIATVVLRRLLQNTILCGLHSHPEKWGSCSPCFRHGRLCSRLLNSPKVSQQVPNTPNFRQCWLHLCLSLYPFFLATAPRDLSSPTSWPQG